MSDDDQAVPDTRNLAAIEAQMDAELAELEGNLSGDVVESEPGAVAAEGTVVSEENADDGLLFLKYNKETPNIYTMLEIDGEKIQASADQVGDVMKRLYLSGSIAQGDKILVVNPVSMVEARTVEFDVFDHMSGKSL